MQGKYPKNTLFYTFTLNTANSALPPERIPERNFLGRGLAYVLRSP